MSAAKLACETCKWYVDCENKPPRLKAGNCRRYPPEVVGHSPVIHGVWPMVWPDSWCGEWEAINGKDR